MEFEFINTSIENDALIITINRPDKLNALNIQLLNEIKAAVEDAQGNEYLLGIILTGSGEKAFAAGADIAEFANFQPEEGEAMSRSGHGVMNALEDSGIPTIAAVNGFALGGGCELAMACHMRIASDNAVFGLPEVGLGVIPGYGATQRLPLLIGRAKATELMITGGNVKAEEALRLGLVNNVVELSELMSSCHGLLSRVRKKSYHAVKKVLQAVNDLYNKEKDGMETEMQAFGSCFQSEDFVEGTDAFLNKRKANFRDPS